MLVRATNVVRCAADMPCLARRTQSVSSQKPWSPLFTCFCGQALAARVTALPGAPAVCCAWGPVCRCVRVESKQTHNEELRQGCLLHIDMYQACQCTSRLCRFHPPGHDNQRQPQRHPTTTQRNTHQVVVCSTSRQDVSLLHSEFFKAWRGHWVTAPAAQTQHHVSMISSSSR